MKHAGFWKRFAAMVLDLFIIAIVGTIIGQVLAVIFSYHSKEAQVIAVEVGQSIGFILGIVYFGILESSEFKGSVGKLFLEIQVLTDNGEKLSRKKAYLRGAIKIAIFIPMYTAFYIESKLFFTHIFAAAAASLYIMAAFTTKKQTLYDIQLKTKVVVKSRHNIL